MLFVICINAGTSLAYRVSERTDEKNVTWFWWKETVVCGTE